MRLHRFIGQFDLQQSQCVISDVSLRHQLTRVFRMSVGDELLLCDGNHQEARCAIVDIDANEVVVKILEKYSLPKTAKHIVWLFFSIIKSDHVDMVVEKATELGVTYLVPMVTERTIKKNVRIDRLQAIAREASEQCGRGDVPKVLPVMSLKEAFAEVATCDLCVFSDMGGVGIRSISPETNTQIALFVGPEGGWSESERMQARDSGCIIVSLGTSVLRAETAAIVGVYELAV